MKVIAVDFDGTLCDEAWPEIGKPHWPIIRELLRRKADGDRIILWTNREGKRLDEAVSWCLDHGIQFDAINSNIPERIEQYGDDPRKLSADEYWDDRAVPVSGGKLLLRAEADGYRMQTWEGTALTRAVPTVCTRFRNWLKTRIMRVRRNRR